MSCHGCAYYVETVDILNGECKTNRICKKRKRLLTAEEFLHAYEHCYMPRKPLKANRQRKDNKYDRD